MEFSTQAADKTAIIGRRFCPSSPIFEDFPCYQGYSGPETGSARLRRQPRIPGNRRLRHDRRKGPHSAAFAAVEIGDRRKWSARGQLAGRSLTSNFQSPEFARVLCRYRFALAQVGSYLRLRPAGVRNHAGRTARALLLRRHLLVQANPSCFSWSAQTVGRLRTSRVTA